MKKLHDSELNGRKLFVCKFEKKSDRLNKLGRQCLETMTTKTAENNHERANLFVKNLDDRIDSEALKKLFAPFGTITSAIVYNY